VIFYCKNNSLVQKLDSPTLCESGLSNVIEKKGGVKDFLFPLQGGVRFLKECERKN
jgi:hypothetical protein